MSPEWKAREFTRKVPKAVSGGDGKSHLVHEELNFTRIPPEEHGNGDFSGYSFGTWEAGVAEFPPGFICDFHVGMKSVVFLLEGNVRFDLNDGTSVELKPGDIMMFDDADGGGHRAVEINNEKAVLVGLTDQRVN